MCLSSSWLYVTHSSSGVIRPYNQFFNQIMKFSFALLPNIQVTGRRSFGHNSPHAIRSPLCVLRLHLPMVQRHNSPAPLRFGSFGSSCSCFASLRPTGGPQNQKREGRSGALPLPFLPSLPLFGCSCSLGGFSAAALLLQDTTKAGGCSSLPPCGPLPVLWRRRAQSTGHNKGGPPVGCLLLSCSAALLLWPLLCLSAASCVAAAFSSAL